MGSITLPLIILGLALAFYIAWCIGSNDAANPTNTAVGSGALSITKAIVLFSIFAFLGALVQGWMVIKTFGRGISEIRLVHDAVIASLSTALWITIASYKGLPISTTHSSVGSVLGIGLAYTILGYGISVNLQVLIKIIISWITSPLGAIALAAIFYILFKMLALKLTKAGINVDKIFRLILIFSLAYSAYSFGANDVGNATGVYLAVVGVGSRGLAFDMLTSLMLASLGAVGIIIGGFTLGKRVINTVAFGITRLDYLTGSAAGLANALIVWVFTTIPTLVWGWGMPISTTHASVSAVLGVGLIRHGVKGVNWRVIIKILASWLLTVPITATTSLCIRLLLAHMLGI